MNFWGLIWWCGVSWYYYSSMGSWRYFLKWDTDFFGEEGFALVRSSKKIVSLTLVISFLIMCILPVYADELEEHQRQLQDVSRQINQNEKIVQEKKQQEKTIMGQINSIEKNISNTENKITSLAENIAMLEEYINRTEEEIKNAEADLAEKDEFLGDRLEYIYKQGNVSYMEVLFAATDIKDFLTRYDMLNLIVAQDVELIETINRQKNDLKMKKSDLEVKQKELSGTRDDEKGLKDELASQKGEKQKLLSSVTQERKAFEEALAELEKASAQLEAMIRQLQGDGGESLGTGVFTWPTPGYKGITSPYGMRYHPILKQRKMHTGVDIGAPMSASIVAADSGVVIFAGWMNAYGNTTVVDHGGGVSTLYAHQSKFTVAKGATVGKGQEIGKVGSTGWSTGPHLHFEVRINGTYTDPMAYIK